MQLAVNGGVAYASINLPRVNCREVTLYPTNSGGLAYQLNWFH